MFADTITVFNRYVDSFGDITWYPSVVQSANLLIDKAAVVAKYGTESKDNAILNIRYQIADGQKMIGGKVYLPPGEWERQTNDMLPDSITFSSGTDFDFFMLGEYPVKEPIPDGNYRNGLYETIKKEYDYVFAVTSVGMYSAIPHLEITGK